MFLLTRTFSTLIIIFQSFFVIFPHALEQDTSLSVWLGVRRTLKHRSLVLKKLRITGIWIRKN